MSNEYKTIITDYGKHKILNIIETEGDKDTEIIKFGVKKAKAILENLEDIKNFVETFDKK